MAYDEKLAERIREALREYKVEEKKMFRGITFMVNGKMCISVSRDSLMCRVDPEIHEELIQKKGCRPVIMRGREYKGYVYIDREGMKTTQNFEYWVGLALAFNDKAKSYRKKRK